MIRAGLRAILRAASCGALLAALASATSGCASSRSAQVTDRQLQSLEAENRDLIAQLRAKNSESSQSFNAATQAEQSVGLAGASCTELSPSSGGPPPQSGATHAKLKLGPTFTLQPRFSGSRTVRGLRISQGACEVGRR